MEKPHGVLFGCGRGLPMTAETIQKPQSADDIRLDKGLGGINRAVDVGFGGEMYQTGDVVFGQDARHEFLVQDVAMDEFHPGIPGNVIPLARVSQGIEYHHPVKGQAPRMQQMVDEVGSDESRPPL